MRFPVVSFQKKSEYKITLKKPASTFHTVSSELSGLYPILSVSPYSR